ncbi:hypothetical protein BJ508DRAFT_17079 [Ascobolus immersus RN42]|uniref:Uncharacterized protein n=1 Tax=Ascobolus immersus RN42 TaxID=1160509 RepID=A0A3N4HR02_ASCIM|nr:hypothetical protein BJ508DRAFT_17079 [Ascobolus immersus RN42]
MLSEGSTTRASVVDTISRYQKLRVAFGRFMRAPRHRDLCDAPGPFRVRQKLRIGPVSTFSYPHGEILQYDNQTVGSICALWLQLKPHKPLWVLRKFRFVLAWNAQTFTDHCSCQQKNTLPAILTNFFKAGLPACRIGYRYRTPIGTAHFSKDFLHPRRVAHRLLMSPARSGSQPTYIIRTNWFNAVFSMAAEDRIPKRQRIYPGIHTSLQLFTRGSTVIPEALERKVVGFR